MIDRDMPHWDPEKERLNNPSIWKKAMTWVKHHTNVQKVCHYLGESIWVVLPLNTDTGYKCDYNFTPHMVKKIQDNFKCDCQGYKKRLHDKGEHLCSHIYVVKVIAGAERSIRTGSTAQPPSRTLYEGFQAKLPH